MELIGENGRLDLNVISFSEMSSNDFWEANWLLTSIIGSFPNFAVNIEMTLRTDDFARFSVDLENLLIGNYQIAMFQNLEENLFLRISIEESMTSFKVIGKIIQPDNLGNAFHFSFETDLSSLTSFKGDLNKTLLRFPIIGVEE